MATSVNPCCLEWRQVQRHAPAQLRCLLGISDRLLPLDVGREDGHEVTTDVDLA